MQVHRGLRQAHKARNRLSASRDLRQSVRRPGKPKGMWWRTYERLVQRAERADERALRALVAELPPIVQARILHPDASQAEPYEVGGVERDSSNRP